MSSYLAASHPTIDSPSIRQAGADLLSLALMDARNHSLHLLGHFEAGGLPWWTAGHVGWFAEYWTSRNTLRGQGFACPQNAPRLASIEPNADGWWNPALVPLAQRLRQQIPGPDTVRAYLLETLEATLELLAKVQAAPDSPALHDALYFYHLALLHEDQRSEQLLALAQARGVAIKLAQPSAFAARAPLLIPATRWQLGSDAAQGFCPDNERASHWEAVPEFEIDAQAVGWAQFLEFVDDGGYDRPELWHPSGWQWLQGFEQAEQGGQGRRAPRYVEQISVASGAVQQTRFGKPTRMAGTQPATHVSWWEADAWCRWAGRRLPLELEWEVAAHQAARRGFVWGQVWEWTAGSLYAYPGFAPGPWADYSAPHMGTTRVLRGASWATRSRQHNPKFRGFATPGWDEGFVGFRSCAM